MQKVIKDTTKNGVKSLEKLKEKGKERKYMNEG